MCRLFSVYAVGQQAIKSDENTSRFSLACVRKPERTFNFCSLGQACIAVVPILAFFHIKGRRASAFSTARFRRLIWTQTTVPYRTVPWLIPSKQGQAAAAASSLTELLRSRSLRSDHGNSERVSANVLALINAFAEVKPRDGENELVSPLNAVEEINRLSWRYFVEHLPWEGQKTLQQVMICFPQELSAKKCLLSSRLFVRCWCRWWCPAKWNESLVSMMYYCA